MFSADHVSGILCHNFKQLKSFLFIFLLCQIVQLNFTRLQTECNYDWLDVVDSSHRYGSRIGRYCRLSDIPNNGTVNSTGRGIRLWLHSDASVAHEGFNVSWTSQEPSKSSFLFVNLKKYQIFFLVLWYLLYANVHSLHEMKSLY